jgi:hypothetical protein
MAWNNTVTCSWCYKQGHNRAGCPVLREDMQRRLDADPDDWSARSYFSKKKRSSKRTCSYCSAAGHNRKTCKELAHAKQATAEVAGEWRKKALEHLKNLGLGVGALVKYDKWGNDQDQYAIVKSVIWEALDHRLLCTAYHDAHSFGLSNLGKDLTRVDYIASMPADKENVVTPEAYSPYRQFEIVSPLRPEVVESQVPAGWMTGIGATNQIFDKDTKPWHVDEWVEIQGFYGENQ